MTNAAKKSKSAEEIESKLTSLYEPASKAYLIQTPDVVLLKLPVTQNEQNDALVASIKYLIGIMLDDDIDYN